MSVNGIGTAGYPVWREPGKTQGNKLGATFANKMADFDTAESLSLQDNVKAAGQNTAMEAYRVSAAMGIRNVKPTYETYESENYRIVPDNEAGCFDIYNKQGGKLGVFAYYDIKVG